MSKPLQDTVLDKWHVEADAPHGYFLRIMEDRFQDRVRAAMKAQGVSKAELSRMSGVPYHALDKFLKRDNASTSAENALAISKALGIAIDGGAEFSELERLFQQLDEEQRRFLLSAARGLFRPK